MIHQIRTIDAHTAGEPLRLIVDGLPTPGRRDDAGQTRSGRSSTSTTCAAR